MATANETLVLALPKGRILERGDARPGARRHRDRAAPSTIPTRASSASRPTMPALDVIRVRNFDVATFVAFGAAQLGVAGNDVLMEFDYPEIYVPLDLRRRPLPAGRRRAQGGCRARRSARAGAMCASPPNIPRSPAAISPRAACRPNASSSRARWSWRRASACAARSSIWCRPARRLKANGLVEIEHIADITSRLIVNRAALKTRAEEIARLDRALPRGGRCRLGSTRARRTSPRPSPRFVAAKRELDDDVDAAVAAILADVRSARRRRR